MFCKQCGEVVNENQTVCVKCGVNVGEGNRFCANCGQPVNENAEICLACGFRIKNDEKKIGADNKMLLGIIALIVGGLGIHNFMMGETKKGILKILLCWTGISSIIALVDAVKIFTDKYEINKEKFI